MSITIISFDHPMKELEQITTNWNDISKEAKEEFSKGEYFVIRNSQSLLVYQGGQCIIDCMINRGHKKNTIELLNGYNKQGKIF